MGADTENHLAIGLIVNSAIYLLAVLAAGIAFHSQRAVQADIIAIGLTYVSYFAQIVSPGERTVALILVALSIVSATFAGLLLL